MKLDYDCIDYSKFVRNNIEFRAKSASDIAYFKNAQSFILKEVISSSIHKFTETAREILLLKFNVWFDFIINLESFLLERKKLADIDIEFIVSMADNREKYYRGVIFNEEVFDKRFARLWYDVHKPVYEYVIKKLRESGMNISQYFSNTVTMLVEVLNHTLYEVYELDIVTDNEDDSIVLNFDSLVPKIKDLVGINLLEERRKIYMKENTTAVQKVYVKNHTDDVFEMTSCYKELKELEPGIVIQVD